MSKCDRWASKPRFKRSPGDGRLIQADRAMEMNPWLNARLVQATPMNNQLQKLDNQHGERLNRSRHPNHLNQIEPAAATTSADPVNQLAKAE